MSESESHDDQRGETGPASTGNLRRGILIALMLVATVALIYPIENWRGRRDWEKFKQDSARKGFSMDWNSSIPPAIPEDQNFFKVPQMQEWFTGRGSRQISKQAELASLDEFLLQKGYAAKADVSIVRTVEPFSTNNVELVIDFSQSLFKLHAGPLANSNSPPSITKSKHDIVSTQSVRVSPELADVISGIVTPRTSQIHEAEQKEFLTDVNLRPIRLQPLAQVEPLHFVIRSDSEVDKELLRKLFLVATHLNVPSIEAVGVNEFRVCLARANYIPAAQYIEWSDTFKDDLDAVRTALNRPYARMDGDYENPANFPIPNFLVIRIVAQTLALRTQSYLLLNKPEQAFHELNLLNDLARILEARPTSRPMTLVAAMINVAVRQLYVSIIADGIRLHGWNDAELAFIQEKLASIDLLPYVRISFEFEARCFGHMVETSTPDELAQIVASNSQLTFPARLKDMDYMAYRVAPEGWLFQNALASSSLIQGMLGAFDLTNQTINPRRIDEQARKETVMHQHTTPYTFLARKIVPNFSRATESAAKTQTLISEAFIVCALQRHKLIHGSYPATLDQLVPQFAKSLPHDLIGGAPYKYFRKDGHFVLYSIGWNTFDDGGVPCWKMDGTGDSRLNDWVWPY